jgi:hypothetical protein
LFTSGPGEASARRHLQLALHRADADKVEADTPIPGQRGMATAGGAIVAVGAPWLAISVEVVGPRGPFFLATLAVVAWGAGMLVLSACLSIPGVGHCFRRAEAAWSAGRQLPDTTDAPDHPGSVAAVEDSRDSIPVPG